MFQWVITDQFYSQFFFHCATTPSGPGPHCWGFTITLDRDRIPVGARFSAPVQTGPEAHPASCTMGTGSLLWVKRPGLGVDHPPPSSAEVKERVKLYLYSPSGASWPVPGRTLPSPYSGSKFCSTHLQTVALCVPNQNCRHFTLFSVDFKHRNCPLSSYGSAANAIIITIIIKINMCFLPHFPLILKIKFGGNFF